jgi:hypothetical protein
VFLALRQADGNVDGQYLEALRLCEEIGEDLGDGGAIKVVIAEYDDYPAAFRDIGACDEGHLDTLAEFGIGFAYLVEPEKSSVITLVGLGDAVKSGFWEVVHCDDRGNGWDLSVVICEAGGRGFGARGY